MIHLVLDDELCFILRWTNSAPLPCGSCAPSFVSLGSCTSLGSVLVLVVRVRLRCVPHLSVLCSGSWSCLGHPQPPWRTRHGCTVGVHRDPPVCSRCPGSMASVAERQPYVRWTTTYDFKETWFIDVSSCKKLQKKTLTKKTFFLKKKNLKKNLKRKKKPEKKKKT